MNSTQYSVFLWPARGLVLAKAILATRHKHDALQITLALDRPFLARARGGAWVEARGCVVGRGVAHEIDG